MLRLPFIAPGGRFGPARGPASSLALGSALVAQALLLALAAAACSPPAPRTASSPPSAAEAPALPFNLDFSLPGLVDPEEPWGWYLIPLGTAGVEASWDRGTDGGRRLRLDRAPDEAAEAATGGGSTLGAAQALYFFDRELTAGRELTLEGELVLPAGSEAEVRYGLAAFDEEGMVGEAWSRAGCGSPGGAAASVCRARLRLRAPADSFQLRVEYAGHGRAEVGPFRLRLDDELWQAPSSSLPPPEVEAWARRGAIPLVGTAPELPRDDLAALRTLLGDAPFVLLGEATHGTREFFRLRDRLVRWLLEDEGFTVFVIEDHSGAARRVESFLDGRIDEPADEAMSDLFGVWKRQETLEMIRWMRAARERGTADFVFEGVDVQNPLFAIRELIELAAAHDPGLRDIVETELGSYRDAWEESRYPLRSSEQLESWAAGARRVEEELEARRAELERRAGREPAARALRNARLVRQAAELAASGDALLRDRFMAENLVRLRGSHPPGTRIVVWAHNTHVRLADGWMGEHLERLAPGEVVSIGITTQEGDYTAYDAGERRMRTYPLLPAPPGSVEDLLRRLGPAVLALDLRPARRAQEASWLREPRLHRNIGLYPADLGFYPVVVPEHFHALLFVARTSPTRPIEEDG